VAAGDEGGGNGEQCGEASDTFEHDPSDLSARAKPSSSASRVGSDCRP
jgi:hypothetical protein